MAQAVEEQLQNLALGGEQQQVGEQQQIQQGEQQQQQPTQSELHRVCANGNLDQVRAVLSQGLDALETVDPTTGCTPIVLAIQANHPDVVRELLTAGAIVPPPGLTGDPLLLSILYPHLMHFAPPPMHYNQQYQQEYYPPQGYYSEQAPPFMPAFPDQRKDVQAANLPPADVAKMIPCRNFPACKYGNACMFLHPAAPFYPGPQGFQGFAPQGFYPPPPFQMEYGVGVQDPTSAHVPSALTPAFVPGFAVGSPPPIPFGVGASPMSPTLPAEQLQFIPRRMSQSQGPGPKGFHGKKPSFSGGKGMGPWAGAGRPLGQWKDGVPPPCAFFAQGKCRNAEYCKFPHLDAEGNDCRHPDVIRGVIPPLPSSGPRLGRMGPSKGPFDPNFRRAMPAPAPTAQGEMTAPSASIPAKPFAAVTPARAASNPGMPRAISPRRMAARPFAAPGPPRASSAGGNNQRVPSADEFPALAGSTGSLASVEKREGNGNGKTAAQVLSAPAPVKPVSAAASNAGDASESTTSESSQGVTMDSDLESDAVVVSCKPSAINTPSTSARLSPEPTSVENNSKPMSFASIAGPQLTALAA